MTGPDGWIRWDGIPHGPYTATQTLPPAYEATLPTTAATEVLIHETSYLTFTLRLLPSHIGDFVWYDADGNGIQDVGEPGIGNVLMHLYSDDGDGIFEPGGQDALVDFTVTDADGGYLFRTHPGTYWVDPQQSSPALAGLTHTAGPESRPDPFLVTVGLLEIYREADFGYRREPTIPDAAIVGDTVWYDGDGDGIEDPGEPGIPGVTVELRNAYTFALVASTTTNINGKYLFTNVPAGTYYVDAINASLPALGLVNTTPDPTMPFSVAAGGQYLDADIGFKSSFLSRIGGTVWNDRVPDGTLDLNGADNILGTADDEQGIPSVSVDLIRDTNNDGVWDLDGADNTLGTADDEPIIATDTTDTNGDYLFGGVPPGNYLVVVSDTTNTLEDYSPTIGPNPGANNNSQTQPYRVAVGPGGNNFTADFGYHMTGEVGHSGVIGNQVWYDDDNDGLYEPRDGQHRHRRSHRQPLAGRWEWPIRPSSGRSRDPGYTGGHNDHRRVRRLHLRELASRRLLRESHGRFRRAQRVCRFGPRAAPRAGRQQPGPALSHQPGSR